MVKPFVLVILAFASVSSSSWAGCERHLSGPDNRPRRSDPKNPFFRPSHLLHGAFPYADLSERYFWPAFVRKLRESQERYKALRRDSQVPSFDNTILVLEQVLQPLEEVQQVFYNLTRVLSTPALERIEKDFGPRFAALENQLMQDPVIFAKVEKLYLTRDQLPLDPDQLRLLVKTYREFVRSGAKLSPQAKVRVTQIDERLTVLTTVFRNNVRHDKNAFTKWVMDPLEVDGIPKHTLDLAAQTARGMGREGWIFDLKAGLQTVLQYANHRPLREELWRADNAVAMSGSHDNRPVLLEIAKLRQERARILGYDSHAHYVLEERMAQNPQTVQAFLSRMGAAYRTSAEKELAELRAFAQEQDLKPWDTAYYARALRTSRFGFDAESLKPYFPLSQVIDGAFYAAHRRYGVTFHPREELPTWHPDAKVYEVRDRDGSFLALYYLDPIQRASKDSGAWNGSLQAAHGSRRPHVVNVASFSPASAEAPTLLSLQNVITIFHELGHGLHAMFTRARYSSQSGTRVARDFVELPSQLNENWAIEPEVLNRMARHYQTGEPLSHEMVQKVREAANFQAGFTGLRSIGLATLDLAWHTTDVSQLKVEDLQVFEDQVMAPFRLLKNTPSSISPTFTHIFSGGYSSGYYGYRWSDVLAADAFSVFKREGTMNSLIAERFRTEILERGDTEDPAVLFRNFVGRDPDPQALLRQEGLLPPE